MCPPRSEHCRWFKSSHSAHNGDCVECAILPTHVAVRDSKDRGGSTLVIPSAQWTAFLTAAVTTEFSAPRPNAPS
ncbi:DUF397 domain-containing protein [Plantactinospora sp. KLBMP9567]|nr:DUF397 domain-containing protein [Plantactinospora sp. KLBMP9567]MDW5327432.1 DUF397 domain-containing protein [Plantactinospora sp. KLBMP9567]